MRLHVENIVDSTTENELNEMQPDSNIENILENNESNEINGNETLENTNCGVQGKAGGPKQPVPYVVHGYGSYGKVEETQQPMSFPKLDTNVSYPVFPPPPRVAMAVYPPPMPQIPHQHNPHGYPVFPPQNSSHAFVLPPPPFNPPKLNTTTIHYSHPNFPSHMPIISSCVPPSGIAPPSQLPQPHIPNVMTTPPGYVMNHPVRVFGVENIPTPMNAAYPDGRMRESKSNKPANSTSFPAGYLSSGVSQTETVTATAFTTAPASATAPSASTGIDTVRDQVDKTKKADSTGVQILPQALVDGAINAAATAYSTAWNALNNLRPKEGEASEFDPVFENNLALLSEMGFNNLERNARLLKRFNNDIAKVIGIICATGGGHSLEID